MLDLFSGLGGASAAMKDRRWNVVSVEIEERFKPTIVADVAHLPLLPFAVDLLWASPPCTEYSRESMPWCRTGTTPSHALYQAAQVAIQEIGPRYWVIENVRGAVPYWGQPAYHFGAVHLWTNLPLCNQAIVGAYKERLSSSQSARRSLIPYQVSEAIAASVEALS